MRTNTYKGTKNDSASNEMKKNMLSSERKNAHSRYESIIIPSTQTHISSETEYAPKCRRSEEKQKNEWFLWMKLSSGTMRWYVIGTSTSSESKIGPTENIYFISFDVSVAVENETTYDCDVAYRARIMARVQYATQITISMRVQCAITLTPTHGNNQTMCNRNKYRKRFTN